MARRACDGQEPARLQERRVMGLRIVLASVLLSLATAWLSAEAQYFRAGPFGGAFRPPFGSLRGFDLPNTFAPGAEPGSGPDPVTPSAVATYRTLCVRLCDGFYFPISFAVPASSLERDAERCRASCGTEARLFYHANPGGSVESMFDLSGQAYNALPTAFSYRKTFLAGCSCRLQPALPPTVEGMAKARVRAPRLSPRSDDAVALDRQRMLVLPKPSVRELSDPASSLARD